MHDLLSFAPRPRPTRPTPDDHCRRMVNVLIDDIQVIAGHDRIVILTVLARYAHEQRERLCKEEAQPHGSLLSS